MLEVLSRAVRQEKQIKRRHIGKEDIKVLLLFIAGTVLFKRDQTLPTENSGKHLQKNGRKQNPHTKINNLLHNNDKQAEKESGEAIHLQFLEKPLTKPNQGRERLLQ